MSLNGGQLYRFGDFDLNIVEKVLRRDNLSVSVTPKMFDVLAVLVSNHGRVVAKDELMKTVWADSFVEDSNLTVTINQLRKILGDDAHNPTYIQTVARRGYRFIPEVNSFDPTLISANNGSGLLSPVKPKRRWLALGLMLGISLAAVAVWFVGSRVSGRTGNGSILTTKFSAQKITNSGKVKVAAISPDGKVAAYVDAVGGRQSVWLRKLDTEESIQIIQPSDDYYFGMTFSRNGDSLFFVRMPNEGHQITTLYRISTFGGVPVRILDNVVNFFSFSPDDKQVAFVRCSYKQDDFCSLMVADADGTNERILLTRPSPLHIKDVRFSPDGRSIAFGSGNSWNGSSNTRLFQFDIESGTEREIASRTFFDIKSLEWLPDGDGLIFTAKEFLDGKISLWTVSLPGGECIRLADDPNNYYIVSLDENADRLISTQVSNNYRLFFSNANGERALAGARDFSFAPNGKIIYASDDRNIWEIKQDGSGQRQLTNDPATDIYPQVSPDNKYIYFTSNRTGENQIWRMNADGSNQIQITKTEGGYPRLVTADGKWILYHSGKTERLWKVSTETGEEIQLSEKFLMKAKVSPDGQLVAYFFRDKLFKIGIIQISDEKIIKTMDYGDGKSRILVLAWQPDSRTLNFVLDNDDKATLWQQAINEDSPHRVADLGGEDIESFSVAPDGRSFAFTRGSWLHDAVLISGLK